MSSNILKILVTQKLILGNWCITFNIRLYNLWLPRYWVKQEQINIFYGNEVILMVTKETVGQIIIIKIERVKTQNEKHNFVHGKCV